MFLFPGQTKNDERTFQFNGNDNAWHSFNQIENISYKDNFMQFDITGIDPFMVYDNVGVNADRIKYIRIRMETNDKSDLAQIFFTTVDSPSYIP